MSIFKRLLPGYRKKSDNFPLSEKNKNNFQNSLNFDDNFSNLYILNSRPDI